MRSHMHRHSYYKGRGFPSWGNWGRGCGCDCQWPRPRLADWGWDSPSWGISPPSHPPTPSCAQLLCSTINHTTQARADFKHSPSRWPRWSAMSIPRAGQLPNNKEGTIPCAYSTCSTPKLRTPQHSGLLVSLALSMPLQRSSASTPSRLVHEICTSQLRHAKKLNHSQRPLGVHAKSERSGKHQHRPRQEGQRGRKRCAGGSWHFSAAPCRRRPGSAWSPSCHQYLTSCYGSDLPDHIWHSRTIIILIYLEFIAESFTSSPSAVKTKGLYRPCTSFVTAINQGLDPIVGHGHLYHLW